MDVHCRSFGSRFRNKGGEGVGCLAHGLLVKADINSVNFDGVMANPFLYGGSWDPFSVKECHRRDSKAMKREFGTAPRAVSTLRFRAMTYGLPQSGVRKDCAELIGECRSTMFLVLLS
jgi:hypothetical protein